MLSGLPPRIWIVEVFLAATRIKRSQFVNPTDRVVCPAEAMGLALRSPKQIRHAVYTVHMYCI